MSNRDSTSRRRDDPRSTRPADGSSSLRAAAPRGGDTAPPGPVLPADEMPTVISSELPVSPSIFDHALHPRELGKLLEGERLGHFDLEKFVGGGGMGAVFRATDTMLGRTVAVKVLSQDQASDDDTLLRFKNEAQSAARLDHQNIARVYYVGEDRGLNYIVFEFIEGENIRDLVDHRGGLPIGEAINYTLQIAEALDHASQRDVVHRDIKPSNVLITAEGHAKLVDMGLARLHQVEHSGDDLTASGVTLGTFDYISPEQARDPRTADVRSDLYSLGCTLYFMLTGKPPFPDGTVLQKLLQHQGDEAPDPREVRPDLPQEVTRLLSKMQAKSPESRYQQPRELIADLLLLADRLGIRHAMKPAKVWVAESRSPWSMLQQHIPWMAPLATLLAIVLLMHFLDSSSAPQAPTDIDGLLVSDQVETSTPQAKVVSPREDSQAKGDPSKQDVLPKKTADNPQGPPQVAPDGPSTASTPSVNPPHTALAPTQVETAVDASSGTSAAVGVDGHSGSLAVPGGSEPSVSVDLADGVVAGDMPATRTLIVDGIGGEDGRHATLAAAVNAAKSGDTIELHFDEPLSVEHPIVIDKKELTIRPGSDIQRNGEPFQPVILFRPTQSDVENSRFAMITLRGGDIKFEGIHVQMDLDSDMYADYWSMFQIQGAEYLKLSGCSLTIRNTPDASQGHHQKVSFFDVREAPTSDAMPAEGMDVKERPLVPIELVGCVVRGEAVFLSVPQLQRLKLTWTHGLLATTEHFLVVGSGAMQSNFDTGIQVDLDHVTVLAQKGVIDSANTRDEPYQLKTDFNARNCIFIGDASNPPELIRQSGVGLAKSVDVVDDDVSIDTGASRDFEMRMLWYGTRIVYQDFNFESFWSIHSGEGDNTEELDRYDFDGWIAMRKAMGTEMHSHHEEITWKNPSTPPSGRAVHRLDPTDFLIDEQDSDNPVLLPAGERYCGFFPAKLPQLPPLVNPADIELPPSDKPATDDDAPATTPSTSSD